MLEGILFQDGAIMTLMEDHFRRFHYIARSEGIGFRFRDRFEFGEFFEEHFDEYGKGFLDVYHALNPSAGEKEDKRFSRAFSEAKSQGFGKRCEGMHSIIKELWDTKESFGNISGKRMRIGISSAEPLADIMKSLEFGKGKFDTSKYFDTIVSYENLKSDYLSGKVGDINTRALKQAIRSMGIRNKLLYITDNKSRISALEEVRGRGVNRIPNILVVGAAWKRAKDYFLPKAGDTKGFDIVAEHPSDLIKIANEYSIRAD